MAALVLMGCQARPPETTTPAAAPVAPVAHSLPEGPTPKDGAHERQAILDLRQALNNARLHDDVALFRAVDEQSKTALARHPRSPQILHVRAAALLALGRAKDALPMARTLYQADPKDLVAAGLYSDALRATGDLAGAVVAVERMMGIAPGLPTYARAAQLRAATGDVDGSLQMWREAFEAGSHGAPEGLAFCATSTADLLFFGKGELKGARASYDLALKAVPGYPAARVGRARLHLAEGRAAEALADLDAIAPAGNSAESVALKAAVLLSLGRAPLPEALRDELLALADRGPRETALALATFKLDLPRARELALQSQGDAGGPDDDDVTGFVLWRAGDLAAALPLSRRAARGVDDARVLGRAGLVLAAAKDPAARGLLERALKKSRAFDPTLAVEALAALATLP